MHLPLMNIANKEEVILSVFVIATVGNTDHKNYHQNNHSTKFHLCSTQLNTYNKLGIAKSQKDNAITNNT